MRKDAPSVLLACALLFASCGLSYAGAKPLLSAEDIAEYSEDLLIELRMLDGKLLSAFVNGEAGEVDMLPARRAFEELNELDADIAAGLAPRFARYEAAAKELKSLQQAVALRGPATSAASVEASVRALGAILSEPLLRDQRPALDAPALTRAVGVYHKLLAGPAGPSTRARAALPLKLQAEALALQAALDGNLPPAEIARRTGALMDGLSRSDVGDFLASSEYRDAMRAAGDGMARVRTSGQLTAEQQALVEASRQALDGKLTRLASGIDKSLPLAAGERSMWDPVAVTFHAALRELLPGTADAVWSRLSPAAPDADPTLVASYEAAIKAAAPRFQEDFSRLPQDGAYAFGGGFLDGTYWNRIGHGSREESLNADGKNMRNVDWGSDTPRRLLAEAKRADSIPFMPDFLADSPERMVLGTLRLLGLTKTADAQGRTIVPKHFPGGPTDIELTEGRTINIPGRFPELAPYLAPFLAIMPLKPEAMMVSHATYPDWEARDLRPRWSGLEAVECGGCAFPASLSPYILRGYLRDGLQFQGLIIADWMDMDSISGFMEGIKPKLSPELQRVYETSPNALIIVLGVHSGLNWITGFPPQAQRAMVPALWGYYRANEKFKKLFDAHVEATAKLRGGTEHRVTPENFRAKAEQMKKGGAGVELNGDPERDRALVAFVVALEVLTRSTTDSIKQNWTDVRSRGGVMTLSFRIELLNQLRGTAFPTLPVIRARIPGADDAEEAWIKSLEGDAAFLRAYGSVDWEGAEMRAAFMRYMHSQHPGLADEPG